MALPKDRTIIASDVNQRDGIGVEIYRNDELVIEIFRDDTKFNCCIIIVKRLDSFILPKWNYEFPGCINNCHNLIRFIYE